MRTLGPNVPSRQEGFQPAKIARALADLEEEKATTNLLGEPSPQAKAWCPFPNEVALDKRLSAAALVLLALRTTFVGSFVLRVVFLLGAHIVRSGLGRNVIKRAIKEIVAAGFLDRRQVRRLGTYGKAHETLNLPACNRKDKRTWCMVMRRWFDGTLSVKELAAYLFLRARRAATAKHLADRFGWSPPTVRKVLTALVTLKLVKREGRRYSPLPPSEVWPCESEKIQATASEKFQATVAAESAKFQAAYLSYGVKEELNSACAREALAAPAEKSAATLAHACAERQTVTEVIPSVALLATSSDGCAVEIRPIEDVSLGKVAAVAAVASDEELARCIRAVTGNRVADAVLTPPGLRVVRQNAAALITAGKTPEAALNEVLRTVRARVGSRGKLFVPAVRPEGDQHAWH